MTTVSIICPYRNSEGFLGSLVDNVLQQIYTNWELLLINDDSSDCGLEVASKLASQDERIRSLTAPLRGYGDQTGPWWPRNHGIASSNGRFIAFLDVDDLWHPCKLQRQLHQLITRNSDMSITGYARFLEHKDKLSTWILPPSRITYRQLRVCNAIPLLTAIVKRELIAEGFRPSKHEDYLLWLNIFRAHPEILCFTVPELLAFHRRHKNNLTASRLQMAFWAFNVYHNHGYSRLQSILKLLPWSANQLIQQFKCLRNPLNCALSDALELKFPASLPPSQFSLGS